MNRTVQSAAEAGGGAKTVFYEFLRIEHSSAGTTYLASPKGRQPPTPFKMIECKPNQVTFENLQHDFPQRVAYQRKGADSLVAWIAAGPGKGDQRIFFNYHRISCGGPPLTHPKR